MTLLSPLTKMSCAMLSTKSIIIVIMLTEAVNSVPIFFLSPMNGALCPGRVTFTCRGIEVPSLTWAINDSDLASFSNYDPMQPLPLNLTLMDPSSLTSGVQVQVYSVDPYENKPFFYNITSTLSGDASLLRGSIIDCRRLPLRSSTINITVIRAPPPSSTNCSLVRTAGYSEVSIHWSPSFTTQYNVEMYRLVVNSTTPSCNLTRRPNESYTCSGLVLGTQYFFSVSAINCGSQEGTIDTFTVQPQAPRTPEIRVLPVYDQNKQLSQLTVQWMQQISSERCSFNELLNYTVVLEDSTRERVDQRIINSDNCSNNLCSISFPLSSPDQSYFVSVNVTGAFGSTNTSTSLNGSIPSSFNVTASSEGCVTSVLCSYPMREGDCFFQYGQDSSYQDLNTSLSTSLNSPLKITVSDVATIHYYQMTINTSSLNLRVRGNFTSGEGARLTSANQGLLIVGVILSSVAIILGVIITLMVFKKGPWLSLSLSMTGLVVALLSFVLWVAVGFHVGLQKNTCDPTWQSSRDSLIISAHVFSDISLLIFVAAGIYFAVDYICLPNYKKRSKEQMSFWQKCLHRSLSNSNQHQRKEKDWEVNKPKDKKLEELEVGSGGRVKELEDIAWGEFRKPGQRYDEALLETKERYYQEYKDELPPDGSKGEEPASKGKGEDSHYRPLDHGKGGSGRGHKDKPARESRGGGGEEYSALRVSGGPSPSQVHHDKEKKDQHYLPLDHKKGGKGAGSKDKPSSTQGGSGEEYSALGNSKESGRKPAKPSSAQARSEEGEHYLPPDHGKGEISTQKGSGGERSALGNSKESGRKPAKPSSSQPLKKEDGGGSNGTG